MHNPPQKTIEHTRAIQHIFPVYDDAQRSRVVWIQVIPSAYGITIYVYKDRPEDIEHPDENVAMYCVAADVFDNTSAVLIWANKDMGQDPVKLVVVDNIDAWQPMPEEKGEA